MCDLCFAFLQYIPHVIRSEKPVFDRFAVIFSVAIVWLYAYLLTVGGAYKNAAPKTQSHCRVDRSGLVSAAPWYVAQTSKLKLYGLLPKFYQRFNHNYDCKVISLF